MLANGYSTVSFDAPAHGKSGTRTTIMLEFIASILEIEQNTGLLNLLLRTLLGLCHY